MNNFQYLTKHVPELFYGLGISPQGVHGMSKKRRFDISKPTKNIKKIRAQLIALGYDIALFSYEYGESQ